MDGTALYLQIYVPNTLRNVIFKASDIVHLIDITEGVPRKGVRRAALFANGRQLPRAPAACARRVHPPRAARAAASAPPAST